MVIDNEWMFCTCCHLPRSCWHFCKGLSVSVVRETLKQHSDAINESQQEVHDSISFGDEACDRQFTLTLFLFSGKRTKLNYCRRETHVYPKGIDGVAYAMLIASRISSIHIKILEEQKLET